MEKLLEILNNLHPDSFDIVTLIAEIGEVFAVTISAKYIIPDNFNSAKNLYALIQKLEEEN